MRDANISDSGLPWDCSRGSQSHDNRVLQCILQVPRLPQALCSRYCTSTSIHPATVGSTSWKAQTTMPIHLSQFKIDRVHVPI